MGNKISIHNRTEALVTVGINYVKTHYIKAGETLKEDFDSPEVTVSCEDCEKRGKASDDFYILRNREGEIMIIISDFVPENCNDHSREFHHYFKCKDWTKTFSLTNVVYLLLREIDENDQSSYFSKSNFERMLIAALNEKLPKKILQDLVAEIILTIQPDSTLAKSLAVTGTGALTATISAVILANIYVITGATGSMMAITTSGAIAATEVIGTGTLSMLATPLAATGIGLAIGVGLGGTIWLTTSLTWSRHEVVKSLTKKVVATFPDETRDQIIQELQTFLNRIEENDEEGYLENLLQNPELLEDQHNQLEVLAVEQVREL